MLDKKPVLNQAVAATSGGASGRRNPPPRYAYGAVVWFTSLIFVLFQFFLQLSSAQIVTGLMQSFTLSAFGAGLLASMYYYVYVTLQIPSGMLVDRYGPRRLLTVGSLGIAVGCFLFASADGVVLASIGRLIMGTGAACAFVSSLNLVAKWFPPKRFTIFAAIAETFGMLGAIVGSLFLANFIGQFGWRHCIMGAAVIGAVMSLALWLIVRDTPHGKLSRATRPFSKTILRDLNFLVRNKFAWINGLYSGLMFAVVTVFVALWGIPFFQVSHHIGLITATLLGDMVFIGVALGGLLIGWLDAHIKSRRWLLICMSLASAFILLIVIGIPSMSLTLTAILMTLLGVCCSSYVLTFGIANEIVPSCMRGTSIGFVNALSVGTAPVLQPLVGYILTRAALSHHATSHLLYTTRDYQWALLVVPVASLVAAVLAYYMPRRRRL